MRLINGDGGDYILFGIIGSWFLVESIERGFL